MRFPKLFDRITSAAADSFAAARALAPSRGKSLGNSASVWIDLGIVLFCILPLLLTGHVPLTDLPNHLA